MNAFFNVHALHRTSFLRAIASAALLSTVITVLACSEAVIDSPDPADQTAVAVQGAATLTGRVLHAETGLPLPGVNLLVEGTKRGSVTDLDGRYTITGLPPGAHTIRASFVGYRPTVHEDVRVGARRETSVNFHLNEEVTGMDEIVVTPTRS